MHNMLYLMLVKCMPFFLLNQKINKEKKKRILYVKLLDCMLLSELHILNASDG